MQDQGRPKRAVPGTPRAARRRPGVARRRLGCDTKGVGRAPCGARRDTGGRMRQVESGLARKGAIAALLAVPLALAGCGGSDNAPRAGAAPCPRIAILADGADLTRYRAGSPRDLSAMTVDARIAGFDARCDFAGRDRNLLEVRITPRFDAERGPAAEGRTADLPWFVAVSDTADTEVFGRVSASTRVAFAPNVARAQVSGPSVQLTVPIGAERRAADYAVRISFQLTPEDLAQNRARGVR